MRKISIALISVSDKRGIVEFARGLRKLGIKIISTGGTARCLRKGRVSVKEVSAHTGFPEILDGRVKTLNPKLHAALLGLRDNPRHMRQLKRYGIPPIDMAVVNLYPFEKTIKKSGVKLSEALENIDIGGPTLLRAAAKNYQNVAAVCQPGRYKDILKEMEYNACALCEHTRYELAREVFQHTFKYDCAIFSYLSRIGTLEKGMPEIFSPSFDKISDLRYGENPHQKAAFYRNTQSKTNTITACRQLHGKELSFNNIMDLDAAWSLVSEFEKPAACIIKHTNPCGVASRGKLSLAYRDAQKCDPLSAFGGIIGLNRRVDVTTAKRIRKAGFTECILAPAYEKSAVQILTRRKNVRLMVAGKRGRKDKLKVKDVDGGLLIQERDGGDIKRNDLITATKRKPTKRQLDSLLFAWKVVRYVKSNAIVLAKGLKSVGIGAGQMSRVDAAIIAVRKSGIRAKGSVLASDAFFPKADGIETVARAGVAAVIQPGGSIRDEEVIKAADDAGIAMVFTGMRHFRH